MLSPEAKSKLPFTGDVARGFILGVLRNALTSEVSIGSLKERALWLWGTQEGLFDELLRAVYWLQEHKFIEFTNPASAYERMTVRLVK